MNKRGDPLAQLVAFLSLAPNLEDDDLLRMLMELGVRLVGAAEGSLLLVDQQRKALVFRATVGSEDAEKVLLGQAVPLGEGVAGLVAATGEAQAGAPRYGKIRLAGRTPTATLAAPVTVDGEVIGVLTAVRFDKGARFSPADLRTYTQFGQLAGLLLRQRAREEDVRLILTGERKTARDGPDLEALRAGPLGARLARISRIARNLALLAGERTELLDLCETLVDTLVKIAGQAAQGTPREP